MKDPCDTEQGGSWWTRRIPSGNQDPLGPHSLILILIYYYIHICILYKYVAKRISQEETLPFVSKLWMNLTHAMAPFL